MTRNQKKFPVIIVGSGFAGITAANLLAEHGVGTLLIDENPHIGGQLLRRPASALLNVAPRVKTRLEKTGLKAIDNLRQKKITIISDAVLSGFYPPNQLMINVGEQWTEMINFEMLLFATGAREKFLPFPGWTLPGVFSTGMIQTLIKGNGIIPANQLMIAGSGLFLFSAAYSFLKAGGRLTGIHELTGIKDKIRLLPSLLHFPGKLAEGLQYMGRIARSGTPVRTRSMVREARGKNQLSEVLISRVDSSGKPVPGTERVLPVSHLAVGYGFVPNTEAPRAAECNLEFNPELGGWVVEVNRELETTRPGIFAAGEITGVGGALKSMDEGRTAALSILNRLGKLNNRQYHSRLNRQIRKRRHHLRFTRLFNRLFHPPGDIFSQLPDHTVICRCEKVTLGDLKKALRNHPRSPSELKTAVRIGMGSCQGRTCGPILSELIQHQLGWQGVATLGELSARPPFKPVRLETLRHSESRQRL